MEARYWAYRVLKPGITTVILAFMKTAISIPDSLFEEADRLAKSRGWSRSELYANAVTAFVNSERFSGVREKLDAVYGNNEEDSAIDPFLADAQARSLPREKW
jgi:metal-responsive CopG/Arc/MetJ family transcriptional regulator